MEVGARYVASAWVRAAPDGGTPSPVALIELRNGTGSPQTGPVTTGSPPDDTWQEMTALIDVKSGAGTSARFTIRASQAGTCFLVDDAVLYRAQ